MSHVQQSLTRLIYKSTKNLNSKANHEANGMCVSLSTSFNIKVNLHKKPNNELGKFHEGGKNVFFY